MTRYRKKPVEVEAWQVGSDEPMPDWVKRRVEINSNGGLFTTVGKLIMPIAEGSYIRVGENGNLLIAPESAFERIYEAVNDVED